MSKKILLIVLVCFLFAGVMEAAISQPLTLNDDPKEPVALVITTGEIIKMPKSIKTTKDMLKLVDKVNSPIVYFDHSNGGMMGFLGTTRLGFLDKAFCARMKEKKNSDIMHLIDKSPMMETEEFMKTYSKKPTPAWPKVPAQISEDIQGVFLSSKPSKYIAVETIQTVYILEIVSMAINKKGLKLKIHTQDSYMKTLGMHNCDHIGYPGYFILYKGLEMSRKYLDGASGPIKPPEMLEMMSSHKSPIVTWDSRDRGKMTFVGIKKAAFINATTFKSLRYARAKPRSRYKKDEPSKYALMFEKTQMMSFEAYTEAYGSEPKSPFPKIPVQMGKDAVVVFLKDRPSDYIIVYTEEGRTFTFEITALHIEETVTKYIADFRFKLYEMQ